MLNDHSKFMQCNEKSSFMADQLSQYIFAREQGMHLKCSLPIDNQ